MAQDELALDRETMRRLGYRTVDMLVEQLSDGAAPPLRRASPQEMRDRLGGPPPSGPEDCEEILARLEQDVLPFRSRVDHPGFFAFIPSSGTWPGALGDLIASACNVYAGSWMESAGPSQLELEVLDWFKDWVGYPREAAGALVTGGSQANMTALACAREALAGPMNERLVVYLSDQAHSSLARAARLLGFRPDQVRVLPTDPSTFALRAATVAAAIAADRAAGRTPLFVSASAGSTNTGAIDPFEELASLCREEGLWLHADAAYGGFAALTERGKAQLPGMELADSITLDPHKWLYQSYECGCLLVRNGRALQAAFEITPDYLRDAEANGAEVNFADLGLQLTRAARAFKLWFSLRYFGLDAFRRAIDRSLDLAALAARLVEETDDLELMAPPSLGIVCFRRRLPGEADRGAVDRANAELVAELERQGFALVSSTRLNGRYAIRICVLNHSSRAEHVERTVRYLAEAEVESAPPLAVNGDQRARPLSSTWIDPSLGSELDLALLPLFHGATPAELEGVLRLACERRADPGDRIVSQWEMSRDFYVIVEGGAKVLVEGEPVNVLGPGDFFGELAALDWGAGYHLSRTATVLASAPTRLLVLPEGSLNRVLRKLPLVEARIRAAVHQRSTALRVSGA
jgi:aromatic-L-amino-acid/L-tryptophan decarboxylase